jgi:hypothetical protein
MTTRSRENEALKRLQIFIGEWRVGLEGSTPTQENGGVRSVFEWTLDGQFLLQRTEIPDPRFPNSLAIVGFDAATNRYTQHYFDSRGIARLYVMDFREGVWSLLRDKPDFTPLDFKQRFTGSFSRDGSAIFGTWEMDKGSGWTKDFDLTYARVSAGSL